MEPGLSNHMISADDKHIFICTGEASGDLLGGKLAKALFNVNPNLKIAGMGEDHMRDAGVDIIEDLSKMGVVGGVEVIKHLKDIYQTAKKVKKYLKKHRPDLVILIDYPGFNLHIARAATRMKLKVLFYVSPQIWAWRYGRIRRIRRYVDHMAVLYGFEKDLYDKEHMPATFVGHPVKDVAKATISKEEAYKLFNLDPNKPVVSLFPGSRKQEIESLLEIILDAKKLVQKALPEVQFALPLAHTLKRNEITKQLPDDITIVENNTYNLLSITDAAIACSGTATLEIGLMNVPLVVIYKISTPTYWALLCMTRTRNIGLCNIIAQDIVAKEYVQSAVTAENIAKETVRLLLDKEYRKEIKRKLLRIQQGLGTGNPSKKAAAVVFELLQ
jgi:lipid-A-disaccharide synthase